MGPPFLGYRRPAQATTSSTSPRLRGEVRWLRDRRVALSCLCLEGAARACAAISPEPLFVVRRARFAFSPTERFTSLGLLTLGSTSAVLTRPVGVVLPQNHERPVRVSGPD